MAQQAQTDDGGNSDVPEHVTAMLRRGQAMIEEARATIADLEAQIEVGRARLEALDTDP